MQNIPIITSSNLVPLQQFWKSVLLYHNKPHTVNRKVAGVIQLYLYEFDSKKIKNPKDIFSFPGILYELRKVNDISSKNFDEGFILKFTEPYDKEFRPKKVDLKTVEEAAAGSFISIRILLSRIKPYEKSIEIALLNKTENSATFFAVSKELKYSIAPPFVYTVELTQSGHLRIILDSIEDCESSSADWLCEHLFEKLLKWSEDYEESEECLESLSLLDVGVYYNLYHKLKAKYSDEILKIWSERTDPKKFIHEDIAIAAYLITLWQKFSTNKPTFLDLGCGNGLLVYILNQEGYEGSGIDVRKRKIWDLYPKNVNLEVRTITPANLDFAKTDWIIGNHSDELTPWIPVIAFKNSAETNFFVLPCCAYDFNGEKYKRLNTAKSQYSEYMEYVKKISDLAGFDTKLDKLRIPSTKRQCIVGTRKFLQPEELAEINKKLFSFVAACCKSDVTSDLEANFKARSTVEKVRNCTQLDKNLIKRVVQKIVELLLKDENYLIRDDGSNWNKGKSVYLKDLPKNLPSEDLQSLKKECGGLKTLMKNHRYIFDVQKDAVSLRPPMVLSNDTVKYKEKPCWFLKNHPDGCLNTSEVCAYKHV